MRKIQSVKSDQLDVTNNFPWLIILPDFFFFFSLIRYQKSSKNLSSVLLSNPVSFYENYYEKQKGIHHLSNFL